MTVDDHQLVRLIMHQSIPSANIPQASPSQGKIFLRKHSPQDKKTPAPREYFEISVVPQLSKCLKFEAGQGDKLYQMI